MCLHHKHGYRLSVVKASADPSGSLVKQRSTFIGRVQTGRLHFLDHLEGFSDGGAARNRAVHPPNGTLQPHKTRRRPPAHFIFRYHTLRPHAQRHTHACARAQSTRQQKNGSLSGGLSVRGDIHRIQSGVTSIVNDTFTFQVSLIPYNKFVWGSMNDARSECSSGLREAARQVCTSDVRSTPSCFSHCSFGPVARVSFGRDFTLCRPPPPPPHLGLVASVDSGPPAGTSS